MFSDIEGRNKTTWTKMNEFTKSSIFGRPSNAAKTQFELIILCRLETSWTWFFVALLGRTWMDNIEKSFIFVSAVLIFCEWGKIWKLMLIDGSRHTIIDHGPSRIHAKCQWHAKRRPKSKTKAGELTGGCYCCCFEQERVIYLNIEHSVNACPFCDCANIPDF
jgi:hypothetical protein